MKNKNTYIAIALLAAFVLWIGFTIFPIGSDTKPSGPTKTKSTYEPQFKEEGSLVFIDQEKNDTIQTIAIELAETPQEIQYGMMYRKHVPENTGMLFLMDTERPQSFWMRNTYVSLDIIYINSKMEIVSIQKNAQPLNDKSLPSTGPASLVLEVAGGYCDAKGIKAGDKIAYSRN